MAFCYTSLCKGDLRPRDPRVNHLRDTMRLLQPLTRTRVVTLQVVDFRE